MKDSQLEYHVAKFLKDQTPRSYTRFELADHFGTSPEYMRDVLRNLVNAKHYEIRRAPLKATGCVGRPRWAYAYEQAAIETALLVIRQSDAEKNRALVKAAAMIQELSDLLNTKE
jgi:predicted ArsR family transcriptional regulator